MSPSEYFEAGQLQEAIEAAIEETRRRPTDTAIRGFLAQMLCFAGDLDRADKQLETIGHQKTEAILGVALARQLIRAEQARQQFYTQGRLPEFLGDPPPHLRLQLEASIRLREGDLAGAGELLTQADEQRPQVCGTCDGTSFEDMRDLDDLTAGFLETLTSNGKYYWVPFERIETIEFHEPQKPFDLLWRRVRMIVRQGPDGEVFLPTLYAGTSSSDEDSLRLGRATDWSEQENNFVRGTGQRVFLIGNTDCPILQLQELNVSGADDAN